MIIIERNSRMDEVTINIKGIKRSDRKKLKPIFDQILLVKDIPFRSKGIYMEYQI